MKLHMKNDFNINVKKTTELLSKLISIILRSPCLMEMNIVQRKTKGKKN